MRIPLFERLLRRRDDVSKSGSPISRCTTERPCASRARALTSTSKAVSCPIWFIRSAGVIDIQAILCGLSATAG